jgi:uncharacterized membrane protein
MTLKSMWRTVVTGAVLLIPVLALFYFLAQIFLVGVKVGRPVVESLGIERVTGFVLVNLLGLALVLALCFLAGLAARMRYVTERMEQLDDILEKRMPGYAIVVGALRGAVDGDVAVEKLKTVLARTAGGRRLGFEVERMPGGQVVVFLPNSPHPQTGVSMVFAEADVEVIDLPALKVFEILQFHGKGMGPLAAKASASPARDAGGSAKRPAAPAR